MVEMKGKKKTT